MRGITSPVIGMKWCVIHVSEDRSRSGKRCRDFGSNAFLPRFLVLAALLVLSLGLLGWGWARKDVTLVVGDRSWRVVTCRETVAGVLADQGVRLAVHDVVSPGLDASLRDGDRIEIFRAVPVTVRADGHTLRILTASRNVGGVLRECGITLGRHDLVIPESVDRVRAGLAITVTRVDLRIEERQVTVPSHVIKRPDRDLARGLSQVLQSGSSGQEWQRWEIVCHDGRLVQERLVDRRMVRAPRDRVVAVGMADTVSRGGRLIHFRQAYEMRATAYTYTGNNCATGVPPGPGIVAVDPRVIPLGSNLYIEGYGYAQAMDTGGSIKGRMLDVFFTTREAALQWGVRQVRAYILG